MLPVGFLRHCFCGFPRACFVFSAETVIPQQTVGNLLRYIVEVRVIAIDDHYTILIFLLRSPYAETGQRRGDRRHMERTTLQRGIAPGFIIGRENGHIQTQQQIVVFHFEQRILSVQVIRYEHRTHLAFARRSTIQVRNHDEGHHLFLRLVAMVYLLRQLIQGHREHIDSFVFHLQPSRYTYEQCVLRHYPAEQLSRHTMQGFARLGSFLIKILALRHIGRFKTVRRHDIYRFIQQLLALPRRDITHRCEAVCPMRRLFLHRMLGHHIQFVRHLISVVSLEIIVQRFTVSCYRTTDTRCMSREQGSDLRTMVLYIKDRESCLPLIRMHAETRLPIFNF